VRYGTKARSPGEDLRESLPEYSSSSFLAFAGSKEEDKKPRPKEIQEYHSILFKPNIDTKKSNTTSRYFFVNTPTPSGNIGLGNIFCPSKLVHKWEETKVINILSTSVSFSQA